MSETRIEPTPSTKRDEHQMRYFVTRNESGYFEYII